MVKTAEKFGYDFELLNEVIRINEHQPQHFIDRIEERLGGFAGKTIGLLGLAFKPNTDDIRDAKSLIIIERLLAGGAKVRAYDPVASHHVQAEFPDVEYVKTAYEVSENADAVILVTEWNEFKNLDLERLAASAKQKIFFDGRRIYKPRMLAESGWEYFTIGS